MSLFQESGLLEVAEEGRGLNSLNGVLGAYLPPKHKVLFIFCAFCLHVPSTNDIDKTC